MSGQWEFNKSDPSSVRVGLTQRDQFNNDDVGLAEALVREVIQNSSDASDRTGPVKVRFSLKTLNKTETPQLEQNLASLLPHLKACGFTLPNYENGSVKVLCIEDFNTIGLRRIGKVRATGWKMGARQAGLFVCVTNSLFLWTDSAAR